MAGVEVTMSLGDELFYGLCTGTSIILILCLFPIIAETIASAICKIKTPFRKQE